MVQIPSLKRPLVWTFEGALDPLGAIGSRPARHPGAGRQMHTYEEPVRFGLGLKQLVLCRPSPSESDPSGLAIPTALSLHHAWH